MSDLRERVEQVAMSDATLLGGDEAICEFARVAARETLDALVEAWDDDPEAFSGDGFITSVGRLRLSLSAPVADQAPLVTTPDPRD